MATPQDTPTQEDYTPSGCVRPFLTKSGLTVRCQSRVRSQCPSCAELYRGDWAAIARSGVFDGPVQDFRFYLLTLTAPSFGRVHRVPKLEGGRVGRCGCGVVHTVADADLRGVPLDLASYDYAGLVAWNRDSGLLWDRTRRRLRDYWPSVEFFAVREWQDRGALHLHALVRIARSEAPRPAVLGDAARTATAFSLVEGVLVSWGELGDCQAFRADGDAAKTIWYLSKALNYVLKDAVLASGGGSKAWAHLSRLSVAARSMRCSPSCVPRDCVSRTHQRYGARGHVVSASRRTRHRSGWSFTGMTRKKQRELRREWVASRAAGAETAPAEQVVAALEAEAVRAVRELRARLDPVP